MYHRKDGKGKVRECKEWRERGMLVNECEKSMPYEDGPQGSWLLDGGASDTHREREREEAHREEWISWKEGYRSHAQAPASI